MTYSRVRVQNRTGSGGGGATATKPGAPTIGTATGGDASASVSFTAGTTGTNPTTGYTATASPGGLTGTGASSPVSVTGLTNGTAYTFTVYATNAIGNSVESAASNSVTPSGVFTPASIAGLKLWLKADALSLADNDPVATWTDSALVPHNYTQATAGSRPLFKTGIIGGKPVVRFDAIDDVLTTSGLSVLMPVTVVAVFASRTAASSWKVFEGDVILRGAAGTAPRMQVGANLLVGVDPTALATDTFYTFVCRYNGASSKGNRSDSGTTFTGDVGGNPAFHGWNNALLANTGAGWGAVDIAEIIVYDTVLSGANVDALGNYLATKYGITWTGGAT